MERLALVSWMIAATACSAHSPGVARGQTAGAIVADGGGGTAVKPAVVAATATATETTTPAKDVTKPADQCAALKIVIPPIENVSKHDAAIPELVDFGDGDGELAPFFEKLARVARGEKGVKVRIGVYGDSNMTNDRTSGEIRRRLQAMWGDAGHGWVSFGNPWGWYHHMDLQHGLTGKWQSYNLSTLRVFDNLYGFAGIAAESNEVGATVWVETAKSGALVGTQVSSFDLFYLVRPRGGSFEVLIDGTSREVIDTANAKPEVRFAHYDVDEGSHRLTVKVKQGRVRVFGAALERAVTGIVVDGLGVGALNAHKLLDMDQPLAKAGLERRDYDLVIETTGTNMWAPKAHAIWMKALLDSWRVALPHATYILWSPPDHVSKKTWKSEPRMGACTQEKHDIAQENKVAFWDQYAALGGAGSMPKWLKEGWSEPDGVHLGPKMNQYVGERFVHALLVELARRLEKNPRLGCGAAQ